MSRSSRPTHITPWSNHALVELERAGVVMQPGQQACHSSATPVLPSSHAGSYSLVIQQLDQLVNLRLNSEVVFLNFV
jgi:hypothetical protein